MILNKGYLPVTDHTDWTGFDLTPFLFFSDLWEHLHEHINLFDVHFFKKIIALVS